MPRGPLTFRQRDVERAIRAAVAAGCIVQRVEVGKDGRIVLITAAANDARPPSGGEEVNEWDTA